MSLDITIRIETSQALPAADQVQRALAIVEAKGIDAGRRTGAAMRDAAGEMGKTAKAADALGSGMRSLAGMVGVSFGAKQIFDLSDSYANLGNRIRQVATSQDNFKQLMSQVGDVANRTRSDINTTGESFVRLMQATKSMGLSQERGLKITETLSMALQSSGASASEAAAGTLQLMQAMGAGALQGDEFRSVAENMPMLLDVLAKQLGVTRGELKKMGAEGKITTDVMIKGLESYADQARKTFEESDLTFGQAATIVKNYAKEFIGANTDILFNQKKRLEMTQQLRLAELAEIDGLMKTDWRRLYKDMSGVTDSWREMTLAQLEHMKQTERMVNGFRALANMMSVIKTLNGDIAKKQIGDDIAATFAASKDAVRAARERSDRAPRDTAPAFRDRVYSAPRDLAAEADERIAKELDAAAKDYAKREEERKAREARMQERLHDQRVEQLEKEAKQIAEVQQRMVDGFASIAQDITKMAFDAGTSVSDMMKRIWQRMFTLLASQAAGSAFGPSLPGFATGGSFQVGGNGGTDTTPVAFMATPGERVTVETPGQQRGPDAPDRTPRVLNIHLADGQDERQMENFIIRVIRRNKSGLRGEITGK